MNPVVYTQSKLNYNKFLQPVVSQRLPGVGVWGITETIDYVKNNVYINFQFDGQEIAGSTSTSQGFRKGFRAIGNGAGGFPEWRWLWYITGYVDGFTTNASVANPIFSTIAYADGVTPGSPGGAYNNYNWDRWTVETSIAEWYKWGARKFWLHLPFGKISRNRSIATDVNGYLPWQDLPDKTIHLNAPHQEALHYQPDSYYCAKHGCTCPLTGQFGNVPMPWLTDDVVDGKVQGFVPLFKALITGTAGDLPNDVWQRLTGIGGPSAWYDPNDPIEVVVYNGTINGETFRKWRRWFDAGSSLLPVQQIIAFDADGDPIIVTTAGWGGNLGGAAETENLPADQYARKRWLESFEPYARAGMRLGLDALAISPGPVVGLNGTTSIPTETFDGKPYVPPTSQAAGASYGVTTDREWWKFFSEYLVPTFKPNNMFCEAYPFTIPIKSPQQPTGTITGWTANPYTRVGINVASGDEFFRAAFGTNSPTDPPGVATRERGHYLEEYGNVEVVRSALQWGLPLHVGYFDPSDGKTYANGRFWYLLPWASRQTAQFGDGSAQGSGLHPFIDLSKWNQGYRYLRADGEDISEGYGNGPLLADVVAFDFLSRYQVQKQDFEQGQGNKGDPSSVVRDRTMPKTFIGNLSKRRLLPFTSKTVPHPGGGNVSIPVLGRDIPGGFTFINGVTFFPTSGLTNDFNGKYPTIREFANALVPILTGTQTLDPRKVNFGAPQTIIDSGKLVQEIADTTAKIDRVEKIHGVMWLDIAAYDAFAGTNLFGISGGQFYVPTIENDIPVNRLHHWLDIELLNWKRRYGFMPKYIAWNLTEYGFSGVSANGEPLGFEMERYFFLPKTIPNYNNVRDFGENFNGYRDTINNRRHLYWAVQQPGITWDASIGSERLVNRGYDIGYEKETTPGNFVSVPADPLYTASKDLVVDLVRKTKYWRDTRGLSGTSKITVYHIPYLPPYALPVPRITGQREAAVAVTSNAGVWNDIVFPKGATVDNPQAAQLGVVGWYTSEETEQIKRSIKLEYRKRYEPVVKEIEALFPEDYDRGRYHLPSDTFTDPWISTKKETLNVSNDFRTKGFWSTTNASDLGTVWSGEIHPLIHQNHIGGDNEVLAEADPKTQKDGNLFDYDSYYHRLIDWVRDDYLRPKYVGLTATVQGMSMWDSAQYQVFNAIRTGSSTYPGINTDRDRMVRWLKAEYGNGATVDWGNSADVDLKVRQYFSIIFNLNRKMLERFRTGIPRVDVIDPYSHVPFAASWSTGYGRSTNYTLGHPSLIEGRKITDVVPMIFAGESADRPWAALLRYEISPGYTGNIPGGNFTNIVNQYNSVPKGKRVLLPYYWHQDPVADQFTPTEYYKATADGSTYTGSLALRAHEIPGQVKFASPWAYVQMKDAKDSVRNFLQAMYATGGKVFDYIADDAESWGLHSLGGAMNVFDGPFGPTGMPAGSTSNPGVTLGSHIEIYPTWRVMPDTRVTSTIVRDSRFTGLTVAVDGLSFSGSILKKYKSIVDNADRGIFTNTNIPPSNDTQGITAAQVLEFYIKEGPAAISACTGPAWAAQYGPPYSTLTRYVTPTQGVSSAANPWRSPFGSQLFTLTDGKISNKYMAWLAFDSTLKDFAFSNLKKGMWVDTVEGFTSSDLRGTAYSHYGINATGITDGMLVTESNGHPRIGSSFNGIDVAPEVYGSLSSQMAASGYYVNPNENIARQKHNFEVNTAIAGVSAFFSANTSAKSYIATLRELSCVRAMQRFSPNYWRAYCPWVTSPYILEDFNSYRADQTNVATVSLRTNPKYLEELVRQLLVSGAHHFNYFHTLLPTQTGYTAGLTGMQYLIDEWKMISDGKRVQPINPANGNPISSTNKPEMIVMKDVGGNHEGATGILINGCRILKKNMSSKVPNSVYGGIDNTDYIWRLTAAPQGVTLYRQNSGIITDLPLEIPLGISGEVPFVNVKTRGVTVGSFTPFSDPSFDGSVSDSYTTEGVVLLTSDTKAGSGSELRHSNTELPSGFTAQSILVGSGRPASFQARGRFVGNGQAFGDYFATANNNACVSGAFIGFFDMGSPFVSWASHLVNGNLFGMQRAICFMTLGGSVWQTLVIYQNSSTGKYHSRVKFLSDQNPDGTFKYLAGVDKTLKIDVNAEGTEAKFYIDGELVDTVNSGSEFLIRGQPAAGVPNASGIASLPVGQFVGNGMWAGALVRQLTTGSSFLPASGSNLPPTGNAFGFLLKNPQATPFVQTEITTTRGATDALVYTDRGRGAWIRRQVVPDMPVYSISPVPDRTPNPVVFNDVFDSSADNVASDGNTQIITGINRTIVLGLSFDAGTYPATSASLSVVKNGTVVSTTSISTRPTTTPTFSVVNGDQIRFRLLVRGSAICDFPVRLLNISEGNQRISTFTCTSSSLGGA